MKSTKKRKLRIVNYGKPSLTELSKPDADAFFKSLLETILDLQKNENKEK